MNEVHAMGSEDRRYIRLVETKRNKDGGWPTCISLTHLHTALTLTLSYIINLRTYDTDSLILSIGMYITYLLSEFAFFYQINVITYPLECVLLI